jgi:hypothetical protein
MEMLASTQISGSPWSSDSVTVTLNATNNVTFEFATESTPPVSVQGYFYNANNDDYTVSTFGLGNNGYQIGQGFTSTVSSNQASNDFFTNFSGSNELKFDLTAGNYGGVKKNIPPVYVHAYLVFTFAG